MQWQDGNTSNPRTVTVNGNATYTAFFEIDENQGVDDIDKTEFLVYPSPATATLNIVVDVCGEAVILDVTGRTTLSSSVVPGANTIDVSNLPNGVYFIKIGNSHASFIKH